MKGFHLKLDSIYHFLNEPTPEQAPRYHRKGSRPKSRCSETSIPERVADILCGERGKPRGIGPVENKSYLNSKSTNSRHNNMQRRDK